MAGITFIRRDQNDESNIVRVVAENTLTEVGTAGYLLGQAANIAALNNASVEEPFDWQDSDLALIYCSDGHGFFEISDDREDFVAFAMAAGVVGAPVTIGDFAVFQSTSGNLEDLGYLPSDATKTRVVMAGSAVVANNIAHFVDTAGTIDDTAAAVTNMGSIYAGASGTAGVLRSYPATVTTGYLGLTAVANSADYAIQITNAPFGQASVLTIPDPADATAAVIIAPSALVNGNLVSASGTAGLVADSAVAVTNVQLKSGIKAATTANIGGAGAGPLSVVVAGATAASVVVATIESSSNPASVLACTATATGFDVTLSADPGASCLLNYILFIAAQ